jgi:hypothetical protein
MVDPYQIRRDLIAIRSSHSGNDAVTAPTNKLLGKIAHIRETNSPARKAELNRLIAETAEELPAGMITGLWH